MFTDSFCIIKNTCWKFDAISSKIVVCGKHLVAPHIALRTTSNVNARILWCNVISFHSLSKYSPALVMHFWRRFTHFSYTSLNHTVRIAYLISSRSWNRFPRKCSFHGVASWCQLVPCGLESHRTFHEYDTHHFSHQFNYLRLLLVWSVTILPYHRQAHNNAPTFHP